MQDKDGIWWILIPKPLYIGKNKLESPLRIIQNEQDREENLNTNHVHTHPLINFLLALHSTVVKMFHTLMLKTKANFFMNMILISSLY